MHYLEDYLELIEQLPIDLRDRFTEIREMDLQVQNGIDDLEMKVREFLSNAATATQEWRDEYYKILKQEYTKALDDAEEKVSIASSIYDLVDRHLRKLDQELSKFKMELEADNAGITEILEQRSLQLDEVSTPEVPNLNTLQPIQPLARNIIPPSAHSHKRKATTIDVFADDLPNGEISVPVSTVSLPDYNSCSGSFNIYMSLDQKMSLPGPQSMQYSIGTVGASTSAAPSHSDSQLYPMPGRKNSNTKGYGQSIKSEYPGLSINTSMTSTTQMGGPYPGTPAALNINYGSSPSMSHLDLNSSLNPSPSGNKQSARSKKQKTPIVDSAPLQTAVISQSVDWVYDPNEPRYCLCNQVSYGEMVGCDNPNCPIEWFHYGCVGITDPPKGKWFCPKCYPQTSKKRRR